MSRTLVAEHARATKAVAFLADVLARNGPGKLGTLDSIVVPVQLVEIAWYFDLVAETPKPHRCRCDECDQRS